MTSVQKLYEASKAAFGNGGTASPQSLQRIRIILDKVKPSDVGLVDTADGDGQRGFGFFGLNGRKGRHSAIVPRWAPPITYLHLYECEDFSMGIFCFPTAAAIPLHNHPGMTVFSKLLYGSLHVRAYDWVANNSEVISGSSARQAKLVQDQVITAPCSTEELYPTSGGNIHAFTAVTHCAVLDVLAPPYDSRKGRNCTYYRELPPFAPVKGIPVDKGDISSNGKEVCTWLEEFEPPDDFIVQRGQYRGPQVMEI